MHGGWRKKSQKTTPYEQRPKPTGEDVWMNYGEAEPKIYLELMIPNIWLGPQEGGVTIHPFKSVTTLPYSFTHTHTHTHTHTQPRKSSLNS